MGFCSDLIKKHQLAWNHATRHPFLDDCASGEIKPQQFNTWLVQDYLFVVEFTRMAARLLSVAPVPHLDPLLGGLGALKDELLWFVDKGNERDLNFDTPLQQTNQDYCNFMASLASETYFVQAIAFWAIELAYNQAWQLPGLMAAPYNEFADRWGNTGFTEYVQLLEKQADEGAESGSPKDIQKAEEVFMAIAKHEQNFWQMAYAAENGS